LRASDHSTTTRSPRPRRAVDTATLVVAAARAAPAVAVALGITLGASPHLSAQEPARTTVGLSVGSFLEYPSAFGSRHCQAGAWGATGTVAHDLSRIFSLRLATTLSAEAGEQECDFPAAPAPSDGGQFSRVVVDEHLPGVSVFASHLSVAARGPEFLRLAPWAHVGVGRLWDKRLGSWTAGAGVQFGWGSNAIALEAERWNIRVDRVLEILTDRDSGQHELVRAEALVDVFRPYLVRIGFERRIR